MTKRPWRSKPTKLPRTSKLQITCPGQCVSVDQMEVREEGFIAQLKGKLTKVTFTSLTQCLWTNLVVYPTRIYNALSPLLKLWKENWLLKRMHGLWE